jgi:methylated-DNA-[protein]-cysteine S-methyltransferase
MSDKPNMCVAIEPDLIATATGEAAPTATARVDAHVATCPGCRDDLTRYREIEAVVGRLRMAPPARRELGDAEAARQRLIARLADLRPRVLGYRVFRSPLGPILLARSEHGVALVEYLGATDVSESRLFRLAGVEAREDGVELERLGHELLDYLAGRRTRLDWPLDLRAARSDFERAVLEATVAVPYGAVESYRGIAADLGKPGAVRAVAQALRHNPLPIVVPCHRIVGSTGELVGYAGTRVGLKEQLLTMEGVPTLHAEMPKIVRRALYHYEPNPSREYCLPTCGDIARRPIGMLFTTRAQAEARGLIPCTACQPDLHPLPQ